MTLEGTPETRSKARQNYGAQEAEATPKSRRILSERVAAVVARGEAEIGFQQISEILGVPGAELVGPLPAEVQQVTVFSAGVLTKLLKPGSRPTSEAS